MRIDFDELLERTSYILLIILAALATILVAVTIIILISQSVAGQLILELDNQTQTYPTIIPLPIWW